ncbi:uncharacterized protein LOC131211432 isoform X2 [Anopheles bellator]|uniref:uncharacterized protein LOC131211432 isoform X2 n=1 Tax=Anopheles bellator TaxID=139047 RepID=UPI002649D923|nr:uncharacterized protein LOC131211432 isoform X2 [Anopheles bellator]
MKITLCFATVNNNNNNKINMERNTLSEDDIRELQDTVVTLRINIPPMYKKIVWKECQIEQMQTAETDVCVSKQPIEKLTTMERSQQDFSTEYIGTQKTQEAKQMLNIPDKFFSSTRQPINQGIIKGNIIKSVI